MDTDSDTLPTIVRDVRRVPLGRLAAQQAVGAVPEAPRAVVRTASFTSSI